MDESSHFDVRDPHATLTASQTLGIAIVFDTPERIWRLHLTPGTWEIHAMEPLPAGRYHLRKLPLYFRGERSLYAELAERAEARREDDKFS